jgi:hypothetical protein
MQVKRKWENIFKVLKEKKNFQNITLLVKISFDYVAKCKNSKEKPKKRKFSQQSCTTRNIKGSFSSQKENDA